MHEYMTRQMVALKPLTYDGIDLKPGDPFMATPDDAGYFIKHGRAEDGGDQVHTPQQPATSAAPAQEPAPAKRGRGRPSKAEMAARVAAAQAAATPQSDLVPEGDPDEHSDETGA